VPRETNATGRHKVTRTSRLLTMRVASLQNKDQEAWGVAMEPMTLVLTTLSTAAGKAAVGEGVKLLREMAGLQQEQVKLLKAIDVKVDALLGGPFKTGERFLEDARTYWYSPGDRERYLHDARRSFTEALGQDPEPMRRSLAALHLACIWAVLGSPQNIRRYLREAHIEALRTVENSRKPRNFIDGSLIFGKIYERGHKTTNALAPYVNLLAQARRSWGATPAEAPTLWDSVALTPGDLTLFTDGVQKFLREYG
jgi:hypothetical protein